MKLKTTIATVECDSDAALDFSVTQSRTITLRFPDAVFSSLGRSPFIKQLSPDEARQIGESLIEAANAVEAAT